jgi:hypothetical protein
VESNNSLNIDQLRTEIAILQQPVDLKNPVKGKFKIPVVMTQDNVSTISTSTRNIQNKSTGAKRSTTMSSENYIEVDIPMNLRFFFSDKKKIPAGTKFIATFVGANINDAKIIGLYDTEQYTDFIFSYYELEKKFKEVVKRLKKVESLNGISHSDSDMGV